MKIKDRVRERRSGINDRVIKKCESEKGERKDLRTGDKED